MGLIIKAEGEWVLEDYYCRQSDDTGEYCFLVLRARTVSSYVYMDTFCFHPNEFILIVKSERSVYMNAK